MQLSELSAVQSGLQRSMLMSVIVVVDEVKGNTPSYLKQCGSAGDTMAALAARGSDQPSFYFQRQYLHIMSILIDGSPRMLGALCVPRLDIHQASHHNAIVGLTMHKGSIWNTRHH